MNQAAVSQQDDSSTQAQTAQWLRAARTLAKRAGCEQALDAPLSRLQMSGRAVANVNIVGAPNSGKSSLINRLIGRNLLPVSPIPSLSTFVVDGTPAGTTEEFVVANAARPLSKLNDALKSTQGAPINVALNVDDDWLRSQSFRLVEKSSLDADEPTLPQIIGACLRDADIVVLMIDAQMPMKRADVELLRESAARGIPSLIAIAKLAKLAEDERPVVHQFVEKQAHQYWPSISIVESDPVAVKNALVDLTRGTDFGGVRFAQFQHGLLVALGAIEAASRAGAAAESKTRAERDSDLVQRKNLIDNQNLVWMQIEHQLNQRRGTVDDQVRNHLTANQDKILSVLSYDLDKTNDVKTWWERDMPFRLRHELQSQAASLSSSIDRQLAADRKWLQEELHRQFKYPLALGLEPGITLTESEVAGRALSLADAQKLKVVSRVGTAAVVIAAGTLFATAGIGGAVVATSLLAGLAAEHWNNRQTSANREKVRAELSDLIARACVNFATDVSTKLKVWYGEVITALKESQEQWQLAQVQALQTSGLKSESSSTRTDWQDIQRQVKWLASQVNPQSPQI